MLKVAVLVNNTHQCPIEAYETVKESLANSCISEIFVLELYGESLLKKDRLFLYLSRGVSWLVRSLCTSVVFSIEVLINNLLGNKLPYLESYDLHSISDERIKTLRLEVVFSKSGYVSRLTKKSAMYLGELDLDLIVNCGGGIWKGEILKCAKHGMISLHHADNDTNRGGPPCFWEVFRREDFTGFIIQKLTEELDNGIVVSKGCVTTQRFWATNYNKCRKSATNQLRRIIRNLELNTCYLSASTEWQPNIYSYNLFRNPSFRELTKYILMSLCLLTIKFIRRLLSLKPMWRTYITLHSSWDNFELRKCKEVLPKKGRFLADPHILRIKEKTYLYVEDCDIRSEKAHISCYEIDRDQDIVQFIGVAIKEQFHISFPNSFVFNGVTYMTVESIEDGCINVYRNESNPVKWTLAEKIVFKDLTPVDPIVFLKNNQWHLIFSDCEYGNEFYHFFADKPIIGDWSCSNNGNPLLLTEKYSRNGGLVNHCNEIFRIAQSSGFDNYGKKMHIMRISNCDNSISFEPKLLTIEARFSRIAKGVHTLSGIDSVTAFDAWD